MLTSEVEAVAAEDVFATPEYGNLILRRQLPFVEQAPPRIVLGIEYLQRMAAAYVIGGHRVVVGEDAAGTEVVYRIVGWDDTIRALIAELEPPAGGEAAARD